MDRAQACSAGPCSPRHADIRWSIEHGLHRTKDVALDEDASLVHQGAGPTVMALLRDTAVSLLQRVGCRTSASRLRAHADTPLAAVALVVGPPAPPGA